MALFTSEGLTYSDALKLIEALKQEGIPANIATGGIAIQVAPDQINRAKEITAQFKASFPPGYSAIEGNFMLRTGAFDHIEQVTNDALSLIKEWMRSQGIVIAPPASPISGTIVPKE